MSRALELALAEKAAGKSNQQIAREIGYDRATVSLYVRSIYEADSKGIEAAILKAYDKHDCPHTGEEVEAAVCHVKALGPKPFGGAARLAWWKACQTCPHKPTPPEVSK